MVWNWQYIYFHLNDTRAVCRRMLCSEIDYQSLLSFKNFPTIIVGAVAVGFKLSTETVWDVMCGEENQPFVSIRIGGRIENGSGRKSEL